MTNAELEALLAEQVRYYRALAPEYEDHALPYRIVKVPLRAAELERSLRELGWSIEVTPTAGRGPFFWGSGAPTRK